MESGIIQNIHFNPYHIVPVTTYIKIPDTWVIEVKGLSNDDIEKWSTTKKDVSDELKNGHIISWDDALYNVVKGK